MVHPCQEEVEEEDQWMPSLQEEEEVLVDHHGQHQVEVEEVEQHDLHQVGVVEEEHHDLHQVEVGEVVDLVHQGEVGVEAVDQLYLLEVEVGVGEGVAQPPCHQVKEGEAEVAAPC